MRDIKMRVLFEVTGRDFVTSIKSHYTTVERLMNGQDNFKYSDVNIIASSQFTGCTDSGDVEIYEDDIVYFDYNYVGKKVVSFSDGAFNTTKYAVDRCMVIGNIHENPELLNK